MGLLLDSLGILFPAASNRFVVLTGETHGVTMKEAVYAIALRELVKHEGRKNTVYLDTRGIPTVGIGHKVLPEDNLKVGQTISDARVDEFFRKDSVKALNAAMEQAALLGKSNDIAFTAALVAVNFQLGIYWFNKFQNTFAALKQGKSTTAISNIKNSAWAKQTPKRTDAFINAIKESYS